MIVSANLRRVSLGISANIRIYATSILHPAPILNKLKNVIMYRCGYFFTQQLNIKQ